MKSKFTHPTEGYPAPYYYIGIDNGVTGSIAIVDDVGRLVLYEPTPVELRQSYTKKKDMFNRIRGDIMHYMLAPFAGKSSVIIERPVTGFSFKAIRSGHRSDEATIIILEILGMRYEYVDSGQWQKEMLPRLQAPKKTVKGATEAVKKANKTFNESLKKQTKKLSLEVGRKLFPDRDFGRSETADADAPLMAEWARRNKK
jgi:hypothetical protein